jgi:hypothetical protein
MGRHSQPDEIAKLKGADKHNPQRYRNIVPKSGWPLGEPPAEMSDEAQACWFEISAKAIPGVLTFSDTILLEMASDLLAEYRLVRAVPFEDRPKGMRFHSTDKTILIGLLARFGMSPSDRTKLGIEKPKDDGDDFE